MIVVCGAGGFIGGHLVKALLDRGEDVVGVDLKELRDWEQLHPDANNSVLDLRNWDELDGMLYQATQVFNLACDMGGIEFIERNKARCMMSVLINTNLLREASEEDVDRFFYASSACVYAADKQTDTEVPGLREEDAYPADPEDGYGWEKLFSERMCRHFHEDFGLETRVGRLHNVYGPHGAFMGGREKAPAAICRKVAYAALKGEDTIDIFGNGEKTRSFAYIDDAVDGILRLTESHWTEPINIGSSEKVTINQLVDIVEEIAGVKLKREYRLDAPQGVNGRNSDNTLIQAVLGWQPSTPLRVGMEKLYAWVYDQVKARS